MGDTPSVGKLGEILAWHRQRAQRDGRPIAEVRELAMSSREPIDVAELFRSTADLDLIAEVKRKSPSAGDIAPNVDIRAQAFAYKQGGAACISVLTDEVFFGGSVDNLRDIRATMPDVAILRKDFTVDERDVYDARIMGADMVLLIVAALSDDELVNLLQVAKDVRLATLCECHDEKEISRAERAGATIIGINQRDLRTFHIDMTLALRLRAAIPSHVVSIAESGINNVEDISNLVNARYDAALIGSVLMRSDDPRALVRQFNEAGKRVCS